MAAEIVLPRPAPADRGLASMRPRRMAAEIWRPTRGRTGSRSFNEAAANGRGNRVAPPVPHGGGLASMRPRRMAAEIATCIGLPPCGRDPLQ